MGVPMPHLDKFKGPDGPSKSLIYLAPRAGFEPATYRLTAGCSTAELPGNMRSSRMSSAYNKRIKGLQS